MHCWSLSPATFCTCIDFVSYEVIMMGRCIESWLVNYGRVEYIRESSETLGYAVDKQWRWWQWSRAYSCVQYRNMSFVWRSFYLPLYNQIIKDSNGCQNMTSLFCVKSITIITIYNWWRHCFVWSQLLL